MNLSENKVIEWTLVANFVLSAEQTLPYFLDECVRNVLVIESL